MKDEIIFVEKYRPQTIDECILPVDLKNMFKEFVANKKFPNLLLSGPPGTGKTTVAKALCNELGYEWLMINASLEGNIDKLRTDITRFASSISLFDEGYKVIILDEADYLTPATQPALRGFIEEFSKNCRFILTCNFKNRIIPPLRDSRLSNIDFSIESKDAVKLMAGFMKRVQYILKKEEIEYEPKVIAELIKRFFPDYRRILNELQRYGSSGKIDSGILSTLIDADITDLVKYLRKKDFGKMRKWVATNTDTNPNSIFRRIYDSMYDFMKSESIPQAVLIIADYQYKAAFVVDQEINLTACLTELMVEINYK